MLDSKKELTPVVYGEYPVKVIRFSRRAETIAVHPHWHDRMELHRIIKGSMTLYCDDEQIPLAEGDVSVISPRLMHSAISGKSGVTYDVIMFDLNALLNDTAATALLRLLVDDKAVFNKKCSENAVTAAVDEIVNLYGCRDSFAPLEALGQVYRLLGLLHKYCGTRQKAVRLGDERFNRVITYINDNFCEDISAATLSRMFGYDEAYFCRKFKRNTGLTVMKYIQIMRLEKARRMLRDTADSVRQISLACGFSDTAYFSNCFKRLYGVTPTDYKNSHIKKQTPN